MGVTFTVFGKGVGFAAVCGCGILAVDRSHES